MKATLLLNSLCADLEEAVEKDQLQLPQLRSERVEGEAGRHTWAGISVCPSVRRKLQFYKRVGSPVAQVADVAVGVFLQASNCIFMSKVNSRRYSHMSSQYLPDRNTSFSGQNSI